MHHLKVDLKNVTLTGCGQFINCLNDRVDLYYQGKVFEAIQLFDDSMDSIFKEIQKSRTLFNDRIFYKSGLNCFLITFQTEGFVPYTVLAGAVMLSSRPAWHISTKLKKPLGLPRCRPVLLICSVRIQIRVRNACSAGVQNHLGMDCLFEGNSI
jgi:hypothetical protein